jgi:hypothetical protein
MPSPITGNRFKSGIALCCLSLLALPIGLLAIGGGPCAGPRNLMGSLILLLAGVCAVLAPAFGVYHIFPSVKSAGTGKRVLAVISGLCACFVVIVGSLYLLFGFVTFCSFIRYR